MHETEVELMLRNLMNVLDLSVTELDELLEKNGSDHIWYEINGADHDNKAIQSGLYNLIKQIAFDKKNTAGTEIDN